MMPRRKRESAARPVRPDKPDLRDRSVPDDRSGSFDPPAVPVFPDRSCRWFGLSRPYRHSRLRRFPIDSTVTIRLPAAPTFSIAPTVSDRFLSRWSVRSDLLAVPTFPIAPAPPRFRRPEGYFLLKAFIVSAAPTVANERMASPKSFRRSGSSFSSSAVQRPST